jgi:Anaphase-promoting complex subunit 11 RING-H2 finger
MLRGWFQSIDPITKIAMMLLFLSFLFFLCLVTFIFCGRLYCSQSDENEPSSEGSTPQQNQPQNQAQIQPTAPAEADIFYRSSMGRILKPVDDKEARFSLQLSPPYDVLCPLPRENTSELQLNLNASKLVLSADFGDNEILAVEETACTICLVDFEHGEEIQRNAVCDLSGGTICDHIFHPQCISSWIQKSGKQECPCCRRSFQLETANRRRLPSQAEC